MPKKIIQQLSKTFDNIQIEKILVKLYLLKNNISYCENNRMCVFLQDISDNICEDELLNGVDDLSLETLVAYFELLIADDEKKINGTVFTPALIKNFIINELKINAQISLPQICDPACGCGSFLITIAKYLHDNYNYSFTDIFNESLYGVDIIEHNIEKAKILLTILALENGENYNGPFNFVTANSLELAWNEKFSDVFANGGFDYVVGNPPYVILKNMSDAVISSLINWKTAKHGNTDLYIVFYELGLKILKETGTLAYVSINSFFSSLNARGLRNYIKYNDIQTKIFDFKGTQMFGNVLSYTCVCIMTKQNCTGIVSYFPLILEQNLISYSLESEVSLNLYEIKENEPWVFLNNLKRNILHNLQSHKKKLSDYKIRNGLATLKNDIFFFKPVKEDDIYYFIKKDNKQYRIEKDICKDIIKPNIIKSERDLLDKLEKAIFPYFYTPEGVFHVIAESQLSQEFPFTYSYLLDYKDKLQKRDKGKKNYPAWYAYGRSQGLTNRGIKILIPYISKSPIAVVSENEDLLYYCGNALFVDDMETALFLKKILESNIFEFYIRAVSKPYANEFFSYSKAFIKDFSLPEFTPAEKQYLTNCTQPQANSLLLKKYDIQL